MRRISVRQLILMSAVAVSSFAAPTLAHADKMACGTPDSGHYFEVYNFDQIDRLAASATWYKNGQLKKQIPLIAPMATSSSSSVRISVGSQSGISRTSSFTAGPVAVDAEAIIWATRDGEGHRQLIVSKSFDLDGIQSSDLRLTCSPVSETGGGSGSNQGSRPTQR